MGHTSAGRGISSTVLFGWVRFLDTVISRDCLGRVPGRPSIRVTRTRPTFLKLQGPFLQALTLLRGAMFIAWCLRRPFLGKRRRGLRHFWKCRPCAGLTRLVSRATKTVVSKSYSWDIVLLLYFYSSLLIRVYLIWFMPFSADITQMFEVPVVWWLSS